jgi:hypothetical protein
MSARYARITFVLVVLALVPTLLAMRPGATVIETPSAADVLPAMLDGRYGVDTGRTGRSVQRAFATDDWVERQYQTSEGRSVTLLVARTHDMKRVYHHPELAVVSGIEFNRARVVEVAAPDRTGDVVHLHVLEGERRALAAYALLYRGETVARPFLFQILVAPDLLLRGRRPMTLVFGLDREFTAGEVPVQEAPVIQLVTAAVATLQGRDAAR